MKESATFKELMDNREALAKDPVLRSKTEKNVRATLEEGHYFRIDEFGIGHFWSDIYVSNVLPESKNE